MGDFDPNASADGRRSSQSLKGLGPRPGALSFRFAARVIDGLLCVIVASGITGVLQNTEFWFQCIFIGVFTLAYFVLFEAVLGWTPGKKIFGLSVHASSRAGAPNPSLKQAFLRNRFLWLLIIPYAGFLFVIFPSIVIAYSIARSPTKQGKHDLKADDTQVMRG